MAWYGADHYERFAFINRALGPYAWSYYAMIFCNCVSPQILWFKKMRKNLLVVFVVAFLVNAGMWFERFVIIITTLARDFVPSNWYIFKPTPIDLLTLAGSFGLFFTLFLLFCRFLPVVAMAEVKTVMPQAHPHSGPGGTSTHDEKRSDYWPDHDHHPEDDEPAASPQ
jgi:molybdopterin-containing oxidoreductase family membrane subunit